MSAPLPLADGSGASAMVVALFVGVAFGWCLERSGLGSARKLMRQFQLTDLAVFKVMFSAIVTAMLGLFWLSWLGALDLSRVYLPETFLLPQLAGGVIFGAGMALAGLCPGTSCVAAATGRIDGVAVVGGFFLGVLGSGVLLPTMQRFYLATPRGGSTLPSLLGAPQGVVVAAIVALALAGFEAAERIERWSAARAAEVSS
ncbi:MAG: YeeE/YedE thiosulfate transporter family protein [bacterium]